jgi:hypothetical protein
MNVLEIARWLNRGGLSAAPCPWLNAISIFVDEEYERFDYDLIGPRDRLRIGRVLEEHGFPGLEPGNLWCLCVDRWREALTAGIAPPVVLAATHIAALDVVSLDDLEANSVDPGA